MGLLGRVQSGRLAPNPVEAEAAMPEGDATDANDADAEDLHDQFAIKMKGAGCALAGWSWKVDYSVHE